MGRVCSLAWRIRVDGRALRGKGIRHLRDLNPVNPNLRSYARRNLGFQGWCNLEFDGFACGTADGVWRRSAHDEIILHSMIVDTRPYHSLTLWQSVDEHGACLWAET